MFYKLKKGSERMIQNIGAYSYASSNITSLTQKSNASISKETSSDEKVINTKSQTDTIEISDEARQILNKEIADNKNISKPVTEKATVENLETDDTKKSAANAVEENSKKATVKEMSEQSSESQETSKTIIASSQTTSTVETTPILTTLSEAQIDNLVTEGTVTKSEADAEKASRIKDKSEEDNSLGNTDFKNPNKNFIQGIKAYTDQMNYANGFAEVNISKIA